MCKRINSIRYIPLLINLLTGHRGTCEVLFSRGPFAIMTSVHYCLWGGGVNSECLYVDGSSWSLFDSFWVVLDFRGVCFESFWLVSPLSKYWKTSHVMFRLARFPWLLFPIGTCRWTFRTLTLLKTPKFSKTIPYVRHFRHFRNPIQDWECCNF